MDRPLLPPTKGSETMTIIEELRELVNVDDLGDRAALEIEEMQREIGRLHKECTILNARIETGGSQATHNARVFDHLVEAHGILLEALMAAFHP